MHRVTGALALLLAASAFAQDPGQYQVAENPFQGEYTVTLGTAVPLRAAVAGVQLDTLTISAAAGDRPTCEVALSGANQGDEKVTLAAVLLLEDANGQALERLTLTKFRVKAGRSFNVDEALGVQPSTLAAIAKVYVFIRVE